MLDNKDAHPTGKASRHQTNRKDDQHRCFLLCLRALLSPAQSLQADSSSSKGQVPFAAIQQEGAADVFLYNLGCVLQASEESSGVRQHACNHDLFMNIERPPPGITENYLSYLCCLRKLERSPGA